MAIILCAHYMINLVLVVLLVIYVLRGLMITLLLHDLVIIPS